MNRLILIQKECSDGKSSNLTKQKDLAKTHAKTDTPIKGDPFMELKRRIQNNLREIRELLKKRNETDDRATQGRISSECRNKIQRAKADFGNLEKIHDKKMKKYASYTPEKQEKLDHRSNLVEVITEHLKEVEQLEKRRPGRSQRESNTSNRNSLIGRSSTSGGGAVQDPTITNLPSMDFDEGKLRFEENEAVIDAKLDEFHKNVKDLGEMANEMGKEMRRQEDMLNSLEDQVDKGMEELKTTNKQLKKTLDKLQKGDKFIVTFIILCILLGIGGLIATFAGRF